MKTFDDLFSAWPSREDMALDLDVLPQTIYRWYALKRIPPHRWRDTIEAAAKLGFEVSATDLLHWITPKRAAGWPRDKARGRTAA